MGSVVVVYAVFLSIAIVNWLLMRRPKMGVSEEAVPFAVLIPARNEAHHLPLLVPPLLKQNADVYVFDDASDDDTAAVAKALGAKVISGSGPAEGWLGKNYACHQLAKIAMEDHPGEWILFLDADVRPQSGFVQAMTRECRGRKVVTGFGQMLPGRGIEPLFLAWVGWILLCTNPFGLVGRTGKGHNHFTNGQIGLWPKALYAELWPHEEVRGEVLEDVMIGRLLARHRIRVEVLNLTRILRVRMYETWRDTLDGMSKNAFRITGNPFANALFALLFLLVAWGWLIPISQGRVFDGVAGLALLCLSGLVVAWTVRAPTWPGLLMPAALSIGAFTLLRSWSWHRKGKVRWKGRQLG
jgi:hypothetical protein